MSKATMERAVALAAEFRHLYYSKKYQEAMQCYRDAVALRGSLGTEECITLFGIRGERGVVEKEGLFPIWDVIDCEGECLFASKK